MSDASDSPECVVVGFDGSEASREAVGFAARSAGPGGSIVAVYAFGPPPDWLGHPGYQRVLDDHRLRGQEVLDGLAADAGDLLKGLKVEYELVAGRPAHVLTDVANARDADMIAVGSRGLGRVRGALGSVSQELLHLAERPVVIIPERGLQGERA